MTVLFFNIAARTVSGFSPWGTGLVLEEGCGVSMKKKTATRTVSEFSSWGKILVLKVWWGPSAEKRTKGLSWLSCVIYNIYMTHDNQGSHFVLFKKDCSKDRLWILFLRNEFGITSWMGGQKDCPGCHVSYICICMYETQSSLLAAFPFGGLKSVT